MSFPSFKKFLLFASGINTKIVSHESMSHENRFSEENKYASIGASIVLTSIVAFLSGSYALYTVFNSVLVSSSVGFIWGIKIFNLDRFVILSSRKKKNNFLADIIVIIPRLLLAFSLGFVIAKPVEIKIFENKINQKFDETNAPKIVDLDEDERNKLEKIHKKQVNEIAFLNRKSYSIDIVKISNDNYDNQKEKVEKETEIIRERLKNKDKIGLIAKIQILEELKKDNPTIEYSSLFITILFIAIDSVPITLKLLCKYSPYDAYIETQEENAIYLKSQELSDIERKNNEIKNIKKIDKLSDTILAITVKISNDKELTKLANYELDELNKINLISPNLKDIRNEILQRKLQITQKKVLGVSTTHVQNPPVANNNGNGQQKISTLNTISK